MASAFYNTGKAELLKGNIDLENDTIKYGFLISTHTPNIDTDENYDDVSADIAAGSAVAALASKAVNTDTTNDRAEFDATDLALTNKTYTEAADKILIYKDTGTPATSTLICYIEITEIQPVDGSVDITWDSEGILAF